MKKYMSRVTLSLAAPGLLALGLLLLPVSQSKADTTPDLSGSWKLDRAHGDHSGKSSGHGSHDWGALKQAHSGTQAPAGGSGKGTPANGAPHNLPRLPEGFTISTIDGAIEIKDANGSLIERLLPGSTAAPATDSAGAPQFPAVWQGQDLQISLTTPQGTVLTQTFALADGGHSLKVTMQMPSPKNDGRGPRTFTRTYDRVSSS